LLNQNFRIDFDAKLDLFLLDTLFQAEISQFFWISGRFTHLVIIPMHWKWHEHYLKFASQLTHTHHPWLKD